MQLVVFGLSVSSSWGNGHATLWRGLIAALARRGHRVVFFEKDLSFYAAHRDLLELPGGELVLYSEWADIASRARLELSQADVGMVTSYCPDADHATTAVLDSSAPLKTFYDLDTPVTLDHLSRGLPVAYVGERGLADFDLVLSYTGGKAIDELKLRLGAAHVVPLYGSVDPTVHFPVPPSEELRSDLSYLGTYAADRQDALESLFIQPSRVRPDFRFLLGGAQYPESFPWTPNVFFRQHVAPVDHPAFYCSSRITLNVTRKAMAEMGYCPSGRLFEAAACGVPLLSDYWEGLDQFFSPGDEIIIGRSPDDTIAALDLTDSELRSIASKARERTLAEHTADSRALDMELAFTDALHRRSNAQETSSAFGMEQDDRRSTTATL